MKHQLEMGIEFDYVGGDGLYGNNLAFFRSIEDMGLVYMLDIHSDQKIHLEKPELNIPERKSNRGRHPKRPKASTLSVKANEYIKTLTNKDWKKLDIRDSAKGKLKGLFHFKTVYIWDKTSDAVEKRLLVISKKKTNQGVEKNIRSQTQNLLNTHIWRLPTSSHNPFSSSIASRSKNRL